MSVPARLTAFAVALAVVFGLGWGIGSAVGPLEDAPALSTHQPAGSHGVEGS